ncbi:MAG: hypothetical protein ABEL76_00195, partial [Bradymonadaceae bacterium]
SGRPEDARPDPDAPLRPAELEDRIDAFDYWAAVGSEAVAAAWRDVFHAVNTVRTRLDGDSRRAVDVALRRLEPAAADRQLRLDLTFFVDAGGAASFEGVAGRFYRVGREQPSPVLTVLLASAPGRGTRPDRALIWVTPRRNGMTPTTVVWQRCAGAWRGRASVGLRSAAIDASAGGSCDSDSGPADERTVVSGEANRLAVRLLRRALWSRFTGTDYASRTGAPGAGDGARPDDIASALGLEVTRRRIDQVYSQTAFPPRTGGVLD